VSRYPYPTSDLYNGRWLPSYPVEPGEHLTPGRLIQESCHREAVAGLVRLHCRLGLGRKDPLDRPGVKPERAQMLLRDLNVAGGQERVRRRQPPRRFTHLRGYTPRQPHAQEPYPYHVMGLHRLPP
jgi:hypothetical protein